MTYIYIYVCIYIYIYELIADGRRPDDRRAPHRGPLRLVNR